MRSKLLRGSPFPCALSPSVRPIKKCSLCSLCQRAITVALLGQLTKGFSVLYQMIREPEGCQGQSEWGLAAAGVICHLTVHIRQQVLASKELDPDYKGRVSSTGPWRASWQSRRCFDLNWGRGTSISPNRATITRVVRQSMPLPKELSEENWGLLNHRA